MNELCVIKVILSRRLFIGLLAALCAAFSAVSGGTESMKVTMFYPPAYGSFIKLGVKHYLRVGPATGPVLNIGDLDKAVNCVGCGYGYGIMVRSTNMSINVASQLDYLGMQQPASIYFMPYRGWVRLGAGAALGNVCTWRAATAQTAVSPSTISNLVSKRSGTTINYAAGTEGLWCNMSILVK